MFVKFSFLCELDESSSSIPKTFDEEKVRVINFFPKSTVYTKNRRHRFFENVRAKEQINKICIIEPAECSKVNTLVSMFKR